MKFPKTVIALAALMATQVASQDPLDCFKPECEKGDKELVCDQFKNLYANKCEFEHRKCVDSMLEIGPCPSDFKMPDFDF